MEDAASAPAAVSRNPLEAFKGAVADGIDRYRALKDAPDARKLLLAYATMRIGFRFNTIALVALSYQLGEGALGVGGILAGMGAYLTNRALAITGVAAMVGAVSTIVFGVAGTLLLAIPALILVGAIGDIEEISAMTCFQNRLPEGIYGRFFSRFMMCVAGGGLVGSLLGPLLADRFSTTLAVSVLAVPVLVLGMRFGVREGGLRLALSPFTPRLDPEVSCHGLFRHQHTPQDLPEQRMDGRLALEPRASRLA